ncbi:hypothetical protein C8Q80DRAFT_220551 [Daedaleopsis nitida]|nr:hypothetical protein C8Q80DRAFT_220551 [Daedaleopsis nitida]
MCVVRSHKALSCSRSMSHLDSILGKNLQLARIGGYVSLRLRERIVFVARRHRSEHIMIYTVAALRQSSAPCIIPARRVVAMTRSSAYVAPRLRRAPEALDGQQQVIHQPEVDLCPTVVRGIGGTQQPPRFSDVHIRESRSFEFDLDKLFAVGQVMISGHSISPPNSLPEASVIRYAGASTRGLPGEPGAAEDPRNRTVPAD